jgi:predicted membrane chloride channel (bestrophin family)
MKKQPFQKDLQDLLTKHEVDKYTGLHNYMMSEHIVRWIEEYVREQNVANLWSNEEQTSYFDYIKQKEGKDVV